MCLFLKPPPSPPHYLLALLKHQLPTPRHPFNFLFLPFLPFLLFLDYPPCPSPLHWCAFSGCAFVDILQRIILLGFNNSGLGVQWPF